MSADIERILQRVLSGVIGLPPADRLICRSIGGGAINDAYQITTKYNKRWFCKFSNVRQFPDLFVKESRGLALLGRQGPGPATPAPLRRISFPPPPGHPAGRRLPTGQPILGLRRSVCDSPWLSKKYFTHNSTLLMDVNPIFAGIDTVRQVILRGNAADEAYPPSTTRI